MSQNLQSGELNSIVILLWRLTAFACALMDIGERHIFGQFLRLHRRLLDIARGDDTCYRLMTIGLGT